METGLEGDERGIGTAHKGLPPLVTALHVGTHVAATESDIPFAVLNTYARLQDDGAIEVELHLSLAVVVAVLLFAGILKFFHELVVILGKVVGIIIDRHAVAVVVILATVFADKCYNAEYGGVLRGQNHQADGVVSALAAHISEEYKAFFDHVVYVDATENRADVGRFSKRIANLFADSLNAVVFVGKIRLIGNVGNAKRHIDICNGQSAARKDRLYACRRRLCRIVNAVRSHIGVRHHIGAPEHRHRGEREHITGCIAQLLQIGYLRCLSVVTQKITLTGEFFSVRCVEGKLNDIRSHVGRVTPRAVHVFSHSDDFTRQCNIRIKHSFREVRRNTDVDGRIDDVASIRGRLSAVQILLILLTDDLRRRSISSHFLEIDNGVGRIV